MPKASAVPENLENKYYVPEKREINNLYWPLYFIRRGLPEWQEGDHFYSDFLCRIVA